MGWKGGGKWGGKWRSGNPLSTPSYNAPDHNIFVIGPFTLENEDLYESSLKSRRANRRADKRTDTR